MRIFSGSQLLRDRFRGIFCLCTGSNFEAGSSFFSSARQGSCDVSAKDIVSSCHVVEVVRKALG